MKRLLAISLVIITLQCFAELPQKMSYQGVLTDNDGNPVANGSYTVGFSIHNNPGDRAVRERNQLWSETQTITVNNGQFRAILGSVTPLNLPFDEPYWLAITVNGNTMTPYSELTSVPFSFNSKNSMNADSLNGFAGSHYLDWNNMSNVPPGFADGTDASGSVLYDAVVASSGGDYTSLQDAVTAGKKTIYVRKGTFTNTSTLTLPDNAVIIGESPTESIITGAAIQGTGTASISNLKITCNSGGYYAVNISGSGVKVSNVTVETTMNGGISLGDNCNVTNSSITGNYYCDFGAFSYLSGSKISGASLTCNFGQKSRIIGNSFTSTGGGGYEAISAANSCVVTDNIVVSTGSTGIGIYCHSGSIIQGNRIEGFQTGIYGSTNTDGLICSNNLVKSCSGDAFNIHSYSNTEYGPVTVTGNIAWQPGGIGFSFYPAWKLYASNNSVFDAGSDGFFINTGSNNELSVVGNSARYCGGKGFNFSGGSYTHSNWNINDNQAIGNGSDGFCIFLQASSMSGNVSMSNTGYGYNFPSGLDYSTFTGNASSYNTLYGFTATGAPAICESSITGNVIRDSFRITGQTHYSVITGNVLVGDGNTFGSPITNSIIEHNVE